MSKYNNLNVKPNCFCKMFNQDLKKLYFHILIIDDDQKIRLLLKKFLENNDFRVSDAENTKQAKKLMETLIFDLLV